MFGYHGKPLFMQGPNDDPDAVIDTLERAAGPGKFDFVAVGP